VPAHRRAAVSTVVDAYARTWAVGGVPGDEVVLHNDLHLGTMVFTGPVGVLAGIWDFSGVARGVPTFDLRYFDNAPRDLLARLAIRYQALTDRPISVASAIVANRMEDVREAIARGSPDLFDVAVARWEATDAGL